MFTYVFKGTDCTITAPWLSDISQIKKDIVQTPKRNTMKATYPNGVVLEFEQTATETIVYSNRPLVQNSDGSYTVPEF